MSFLALARTGLRRAVTRSALGSQTGVVRHYAAEAPPREAGAQDAGDDVVMSLFREQQQQIRGLVSGMQKIPVPLMGGDDEVVAYAGRMEALKREVGAQTVQELVAAEVDRMEASAQQNGAGVNGEEMVNDIMHDIAAVDLSDEPHLEAQWQEVVEEVLAYDATGRDADEVASDAAALSERLNDIASALQSVQGNPRSEEAVGEAVLDVYREHVADLRAQVEADVEQVRTDQNLDWVDVDLAKVAGKAA